MISYKWYPKKELKERTGFQRRILDPSASQIGKGTFLESSRVPEESDVKLAALLGISVWGFLVKQPHMKWNAFERSRLGGWGSCSEDINGILCTCSWATAYGNWLIQKHRAEQCEDATWVLEAHHVAALAMITYLKQEIIMF